jgi:hypothetical protein
MAVDQVSPDEYARTLLYQALAQTDVDMGHHRLINLDTSNLPPVGIPPTIHPPINQWLHDWDATLQQWTSTQPDFRQLSGVLTSVQMQAINQLGIVRVGTWQANIVLAPFLPTIDALRLPAANMNFGGFRLTNVAAPIDPNDAVTLAYMDFMLQGLQPKESVRLATAVGREIVLTGLGVIDGIQLVEGDRVLVKNQLSIPYHNGIYVAHTGAWTRSVDSDTATELERAYVAVREGDTNSGSSWVQVNTIVSSPPGVGDDVLFVLFSSTPTTNVLPGNGLNRVGNTLNVLGTASRISVGAAVDIDAAYAGQASINTLGSIVTGEWNADLISPQYGGTGVNNGLNTISLDHVDFAIGRLGGGDGTLTLMMANDVVLNIPYSGTVATWAGDEILANKRVTKRVGKISSAGSPAINVNNMDMFYVTNLNENIISMSTNLTGSPFDGQELIIWILGSAAPFVKSIFWGAQYDASPDLPLPTVAENGLWLFNRFIYSTQKLKWVLVAALSNIPL